MSGISCVGLRDAEPQKSDLSNRTSDHERYGRSEPGWLRFGQGYLFEPTAGCRGYLASACGTLSLRSPIGAIVRRTMNAIVVLTPAGCGSAKDISSSQLQDVGDILRRLAGR